MSTPRQVYTVKLTPVPGRWQTPVEIRLRHFLKAALRAYGLRCVDAQEDPAGTMREPETAVTDRLERLQAPKSGSVS